MTHAALRAIVAEDVMLIRAGITAVLREGGIDVVVEVDTASALLEAVEEHRPDVVITDIRMPPSHTFEGLRAAEEIHREHPDIGVVVLSQYVESRSALALMTSNPSAIGYLLKERVGDANEFIAVIRRVAEGGCAVDPEIVAQLIERQQADQRFNKLSPREQEILALMAQGRSNSAICKLLFLSPKTVETHVSGIFTKLDLPVEPDDHRRVLAVLAHLRSS